MVVDARWVDDIPSDKTRALLRAAFEGGVIPDMTRDAVRAKGAEFWRGFPGVGQKIVARLDAAVGGFDPPPEGEAKRRARLAVRDRVMAGIRPEPLHDARSIAKALRGISDKFDIHTARFHTIMGRLDAIEAALRNATAKPEPKPNGSAIADAHLRAMMDAKDRQWIDALQSARARRYIYEAHVNGEIPNLSRTAVRSLGRKHWLRTPRLGKVSVTEIGHAVGGWP